MKDYGLAGSEKMEQVSGLYVEQVFIFRNNSEVVKLLNIFHHKFFSVSFVIVEKKDYCDEKPFHLFWSPQLSLSNNFLNIFNKYNVLTLNKYTLE